MCYGSEEVSQAEEQEDQSMHNEVERAGRDADDAINAATAVEGNSSPVEMGRETTDVILTHALAAKNDALLAFGVVPGSLLASHVQSAATVAVDIIANHFIPLQKLAKQIQHHSPRATEIANMPREHFLGAVAAVIVAAVREVQRPEVAAALIRLRDETPAPSALTTRSILAGSVAEPVLN